MLGLSFKEQQCSFGQHLRKKYCVVCKQLQCCVKKILYQFLFFCRSVQSVCRLSQYLRFQSCDCGQCCCECMNHLVSALADILPAKQIIDLSLIEIESLLEQYGRILLISSPFFTHTFTALSSCSLPESGLRLSRLIEMIFNMWLLKIEPLSFYCFLNFEMQPLASD